MTMPMFPSLPQAARVSPARCVKCVRARKFNKRILCSEHWTRFSEWMTRYGREDEWLTCKSPDSKMIMLMQWQRWERDNGQDEKCPRCRNATMVSGGCSSCGFGVTEATPSQRPPWARRKRRRR